MNVSQCNDCVCVCVCAFSQGLLIGLIRRSCCWAPERILLLLTSFFFVCFALMFSKRCDLYLKRPPAPSLPSPPVFLLSQPNHPLSQQWAFDLALPPRDKCCPTWPLCVPSVWKPLASLLELPRPLTSSSIQRPLLSQTHSPLLSCLVRLLCLLPTWT